MTVMLELPPDLEERLSAEAAETGEDAETLLQQKVRQMLSAAPRTPDAAPPRVAGLNRDQIWISEDFDVPLPDEFWLGQEWQSFGHTLYRGNTNGKEWKWLPPLANSS